MMEMINYLLTVIIIVDQQGRTPKKSTLKKVMARDKFHSKIILDLMRL